MYHSNLRANLFVFIFVTTFYSDCLGADATDMIRLRQDLLRGYDNHSRPVQNHKDVTEVEFLIYNHGFEFDEQKSLFTLHGVTLLSWTDEHLKWNPKEYGGLTKISFSPYELWKPDFSVYNNLDRSEIDHFGNALILVEYKDPVFWLPPSKFQVGCNTNLRLWPFDAHLCTIVLGSWTYDGNQITLTVNQNYTHLVVDEAWTTVLENREWKMLSNSVTRRAQNFSCCPGIEFHDILIDINIQRRGSSHTAVIVVVALGIASTVLLSFWLSPQSNERVPLILVVLIINMLYLNYIYKVIPNNGNTVPLVIGFYRDSLIMLIMTLVWTIFLRYLANSKRSSAVQLPDIIQKLLNSWISTILCLNPRPISGSNTVSSNLSKDETEEDEKNLVKFKNTYQDDWTWLAHLLDRVAFIIYLLIYICFMIEFM